MWIYLTSEDIHYFFDCNNFRVEPEEDFEDMYESRKSLNDKRQLYESIMRNVAKEVKKALNM